MIYTHAITDDYGTLITLGTVGAIMSHLVSTSTYGSYDPTIQCEVQL